MPQNKNIVWDDSLPLSGPMDLFKIKYDKKLRALDSHGQFSGIF